MSTPTGTGPSILDQLSQAWRAKGWTVAELVERSGLDLERTTMGKKMKGDIPLKDSEIQVLATCLEITVVWPSPAAPESEDKESSVEGVA